MSGHRVTAALLAMTLGAAMIGALPGTPPAFAAPGDPTLADSAVTVSGNEQFPNLKVTVSQTKNLINQTVTVSWTGGEPTRGVSDFQVNYLQIMQCWGDDPAGPDRTQCQFGLLGAQGSAGSWVRSRQVSYGPSLVDQKETLKAPADGVHDAFVPFWAAGRPKPPSPATSNNNDFFDSQVTNEIPLGRTHGDGTGLEFFEVETVREAAGLGCGEPVVTGETITARKCWLVVVPRGTKEVVKDGPPRTGNGTDRLDSSPLSQSNWDNRIVVPLEFLLVGQACPLGAPERQLIGHELAADAVSRWQPALCTGGGALFSYTQLTDEVARSQVLDGSSPGLALLTNPIPPDQAPPDHPLVYAPVGLSGLAIAFNIEHQPPPGTEDREKLKLAGRRFTSMKLTPRLVAKLLTQSYRGALPFATDYLKNSPLGLTVDPEFLELNPEYDGFADANQPPDALVQLTGSDVTSLLWSWIKADPDASAFLKGTPDPKSGMVVNHHNKDLTLPAPTFPRNDQSCVNSVLDADTNPITLTVCASDAHPFANDMHDAGRSASRGDSKALQPVVEGTVVIPKKVPRQNPGQRALLAVVDAATAARYGLPTAALRNAAGNFVAPTTEGLLAGEAAMKSSPVAGVLAPDPGTTDPAAYPLTALSYAATAPSTLDAAAGKDYAAFLRYAAGPGQQPGVGPGQLPLGMAPLPDELRAQTAAAAATVEAQAGKAAAGPAANQPTSVGAATGGASGSAGGPGTTAGTGGAVTSPGGGFGAPPASVAVQAAGGPAAAKAPGVAQQPAAGVQRTPLLPAPVVGALLVTVLIVGAAAATSSPLMHLLGGRVRRRLRREVMPAGR